MTKLSTVSLKKKQIIQLVNHVQKVQVHLACCRRKSLIKPLHSFNLTRPFATREKMVNLKYNNTAAYYPEETSLQPLKHHVPSLDQLQLYEVHQAPPSPSLQPLWKATKLSPRGKN